MRIHLRDIKTLGAYIRALRMRLAMSQEELADILKVQRQSVSLWETGKAGPRTRTLKELCKLANVDYNEAIEKFYLKN